ncbi:MAG: hypothetical protein EA353_03945 [Puniceicoccaceae bacterium]|nr:MAG: hypothetical protein EA353_03945 [Puniceicoccaceae bacterium]
MCALLSPGFLSAAIVPLDFSNFVAVSGASTTFSNAGDQWISSNVRGDNSVDAVFTITATDNGSGNPLTASQVAFVDESARGNNMRVRVGGGGNEVTNAQVFITVSFWDAGTFGTANANPFSWAVGDELITQISDIDSDVPSDRSDFGGVHMADYKERYTSDAIAPGSSLLVFDDSTISDYGIAVMDQPWGPQDNVTDTSASAQSPVTAAFVSDAASEIRIVVGQLSNGDTGNRHIDVDMTPDFEIIPEVSSYGLILGLIGLGFVGVRRRRS